MQNKILRLLLGDQLNINHSWFKDSNSINVTYIMIESLSETNYTTHHVQKIVSFFLSMRLFAQKLVENGFEVIYLKLDDENNKQNFAENILHLIETNNFKEFQYQLPDEYRLDLELSNLCGILNQKNVITKFCDTEHFLTERNYLDINYPDRKTYLMENFYRKIRKEYNILIDNGVPTGGKWNFDSENRQTLKKSQSIPKPYLPQKNLTKSFKNEVKSIVELLNNKSINYIGSIDIENFYWAVTREDYLEQFDFFLEFMLENFGKYQDAMENNNWSLFHSRISFGLNVKLISPVEIINKAIDYWQNHQERISIAQLEGFVRQIIGWREFIRVIYWKFMPEYKGKNFFGNTNKLPNYYWNGNTKMNCMSKTISQSLEYSYAHHIQRLMITGNFALLTMIDPKEIEQWYLGIYIDAVEWVELPNTIGMSQFADGGLLATKPYISSANYINKMSNYCGSCYYDKSKRYGEKACPFNSLYWNFLEVKKEQLSKNNRMAIPYANLNKMQITEKNKIIEQANEFLNNIENL